MKDCHDKPGRVNKFQPISEPNASEKIILVCMIQAGLLSSFHLELLAGLEHPCLQATSNKFSLSFIPNLYANLVQDLIPSSKETGLHNL